MEATLGGNEDLYIKVRSCAASTCKQYVTQPRALTLHAWCFPPAESYCASLLRTFALHIYLRRFQDVLCSSVCLCDAPFPFALSLAWEASSFPHECYPRGTQVNLIKNVRELGPSQAVLVKLRLKHRELATCPEQVSHTHVRMRDTFVLCSEEVLQEDAVLRFEVWGAGVDARASLVFLGQVGRGWGVGWGEAGVDCLWAGGITVKLCR